MKKAFLYSLMSLILIFSINASVLATAETETTFPDLSSDDPSTEAITWMKENGIVEGYADGTFQSLNKINRAEFMKIVVESITDDATGSNCFPDVNDEWFAKYICYGKEIGIVDGYPDGSFQPANEINFAEASKIIVNALDIETTEATETDPWYSEFVKPLADLSAIPLSISDLDKEVARGEMAEVIWRIEEEKTDLASLNYEELEGDLVKVSSCDELKELFLSNQQEIIYYDYAEEATTSSADDTDTGSETKSSDYSTTNVQVENVDEADIIKNDGEYLYVLENSYDYDTYTYSYAVHIVHAYPADSLEEVSKIAFDDEYFSPSEMYVDGDLLVVIGYTYDYSSYYDYGYDEYFPYYHSSRTAVYTYDISDKTAPTLIRALSFDGDYSDSRKVDNTLYLVLNKYDFDYYYDTESINVEELLPRYYDSTAGDSGQEQMLAGCTDISYMPQTRDWNYLIALAIPLDDAQSTIDKEVIVGNSENIYSSTDNLYIASTNYDSNNYYYDWENAKTLVHRFSLNDGELNYEASGKIPGTILNQFSMDEHEGYFRIAATKGDVWDVLVPSTNNLYILDSDMNTVGSVEGLAPGETLYSTRFIEDRGYLVTFKKVDPLFVVDLSDPTNPEVLGELKIPGFSDYLHPYDENHVLGFGLDAEDAEATEEAARGLDFAWYQGMKVALFDVTDPANPIQEYSIGIGDRGTYSELLYNHKALLFSAEKELLAFPITVAEVTDENASADTYGDYVYQGAYVYNLNLDTGFSLKGTITHYNEEEYDSDYYWYDSEKDILRLAYIDDYLYTVSNYGIQVHDLNSMEKLGEIVLE
ncbi:MAG: beta-propeller domain-containing protein [Candidatus Gracilibacteria bacterium]|jgi:uncharacterized secreted protein with C-terminal beta-propeller domain